MSSGIRFGSSQTKMFSEAEPLAQRAGLDAKTLAIDAYSLAHNESSNGIANHVVCE